MAQGLFLGGTGCRAVAHTRPAFPKNAYGPVGIPIIRGTSGAGRSTQPPEGGNSLGGRPPEAVGKIQLPRRTRPDPCHSQHGRPKCDPTTESAKSCSYKKLLFTFSSALVLVATARYGRWTSSLCWKRWVIPNRITYKYISIIYHIHFYTLDNLLIHLYYLYNSHEYLYFIDIVHNILILIF